MTTTGNAQGDRQATVRSSTGTEYDYNGDWQALFDQASIDAGDTSGRMLAWINAQLATSYLDVNGAQYAFAIARTLTGAQSWNELGEFDISGVHTVTGRGLAAGVGAAAAVGLSLRKVTGVGAAAGTSTAAAISRFGQAAGAASSTTAAAAVSRFKQAAGASAAVSTATAHATGLTTAVGAAAGTSVASGAGLAIFPAVGAAAGTSIATGKSPTLAGAFDWYWEGF